MVNRKTNNPDYIKDVYDSFNIIYNNSIADLNNSKLMAIKLTDPNDKAKKIEILTKYSSVHYTTVDNKLSHIYRIRNEHDMEKSGVEKRDGYELHYGEIKEPNDAQLTDWFGDPPKSPNEYERLPTHPSVGKFLLTEHSNPQITDILARMSYKQFVEVCEKFYNKDDEMEADNTEYDHSAQFKMIKELCRDLKANNYRIVTEYNRRGRKEGRRYAVGNSLQRIWAVFRNALISTEMIDVDQINSHPSIFLAICKHRGIPCKHLRKYVEDRQDIITEFIDTEDLTSFVDDPAKYLKTNLYISAINDEREKTTFPKHNRKKKITFKTFLEFDKEIKTIQKRFIEIFKDEFKIIKKKENRNLGGRLMSYVGQKYEDKLLQQVFDSGIIPCVNMYDGFLILKKDNNQDDLIQQCNEAMKKEIDGISFENVKWSIKPIKDDVVPFLKTMDISNENIITIIQNTNLEVAVDLLKGAYKNKIVACNGTYYFKSNRGWLQNNKTIEHQIINEITEMDCHIKNEKTGDKFIGDSRAWCEEIVKWLFSKCPVNDNLINELWEQTKGKIYFKNGYYDFNTSSFEKNDMNSFVNISRELSMKSNPDIRNQIYEKVLDPIFSIENNNDNTERIQLRDFYLKTIARVMAGCIEDKNWLACTGERNCGKGLLSDLLKFTFEEYIGSTNAENFLLNNRNEEEAKANSFMFDFQFKRAIICNEVSQKERGRTVFDGNKIKKAHSGGDFVEMRQLYQNKINVRFQSTVIFNLNDLPDINPTDANEKRILFDFNSKFIKPNEKRPFSNISYMDADDSIKTHFIKLPEVQNEFALILIEAFSKNATYPERLIEEQEEDCEEDNIESFLKMFTITKNPKDVVSNKEVKELLKKEKSMFTFSKVKKMLIGKGCRDGKSGSTRFIKGLIINTAQDDDKVINSY